MDKLDLFLKFFDFLQAAMSDMDPYKVMDFTKRQWPIVERALVDGEGVRACDSRAHDLTCSFVEKVLFNYI